MKFFLLLFLPVVAFAQQPQSEILADVEAEGVRVVVERNYVVVDPCDGPVFGPGGTCNPNDYPEFEGNLEVHVYVEDALDDRP